jgi:alpha-tubulin suppressor-like RCC1 family protein
MRALALLLSIAACTPIERTFRCHAASQCSSGTCETTGWCSFPDASCSDTGRRYAKLVGDGLANQCVAGADLDGGVDGGVQPTGCVSALALGDAHGCALRADGTAVCWGKNDHGQLGNGSTADAAAATEVLDGNGAPLGGLSALVAGAAHTCALQNGALLCWGDDSSGQLGRGGSAMVNGVPMASAISGVSAAAAGAHHTCVVLTNGSVWCWGANDAGQLGAMPSASMPTPVEVVRAGQALDATALAAGDTHSCAVERDHTLVCWGSDSDGELGDGAMAGFHAPVEAMALGAHVTAAAAGAHFGCALGDDLRVSCFGLDAEQQSGGTTPTVAVPTALALDAIGAISAGGAQACALGAGGTLDCWGNGAAPHPIASGVGPFAVGANDVCSARAGGITCAAFGDPHLSCK